MKKSLLILTGHSKGLGKAILERFLSEDNFQIVAVSRSGLDIQNENLAQIGLDLSDLDALEASLSDIFPTAEFDRVILVNNAGWIGEVKSVGKLDAKEIRRAMSLNLVAPMMFTNAFVEKYVSLACEKVICNISSGAANKPTSGWAEYCSSKAGLAMFSKVAAEDLGEKGFKVVAVAPGIVDTSMQEEIRMADEVDFPALDRFRMYKSEGKLTSTDLVAEKLFYILSHLSLFSDVIQDVRDFELP